EVPHLDHLIIAAGRELTAIRTEAEMEDALGVQGGQACQLPGRGHVEESHLPGRNADRQDLAVSCERKRRDRAVGPFPGKHGTRLPAPDFPETVLLRCARY